MRFSLLLTLIVICTINVNCQIHLNNDEFSSSSTLVNWNNINDTEGWNITQLENYNIGDTVAGSLFILPNTETWFAEYRGSYLYKEIAGDFILTTEVTMSARDGVSLPATTFSLAGIMIREPLDYPNQDPSIDWSPNSQNYIFMAVGRANENRLSFEIKNTCNSRSCIRVVDADDSTVKMRLIRRGDEIVVMSQYGNDPWIIQNRYNRNEVQVGDFGSCGQLCNTPFPDTVQIGFVTYTDWPKVSSYTTAFHNSNTLHPDSLTSDPTSGVPFNPDVKSSYNYIRFDSLVIPPAWSSLSLSDPNEISDQDILGQYSFDSELACPDTLVILSLPVGDQVILAQANESINSQIELTNSRQLYLTSPGQISLENGFEVGTGAVIEAIISNCEN